MERIVSTVIEALQQGGLDAIRGYSGNDLPILDRPLCAVSMAEAVYFPLCADNIITETLTSRSTGLSAESMLLIDVYDDYRHGDGPCVSTAILASSICSSLTDSFTCGKIQLGCVHYHADYDCFCCNIKIPIRVFLARMDYDS